MIRSRARAIHGADCHRWHFSAHRGKANEVVVSVCEKEDGTLIVEVERFEGSVTVLAPGGIHLTLLPMAKKEG